MKGAIAALVLSLSAASAFQAAPRMALKGARPAVATGPQMLLDKRSASSVATAALALALATANPHFVSASVSEPAVVQQYGSSMVADTEDAELRERQKKFLEERAAMKQKYDDDFESTFKGAAEVKDKKSAYTLVVVGLVAVAFIAPMIQFFYYTGGD